MVRKKKKKNISTNQQSFFFEDYLNTNQKYDKEKKIVINEDRIYLLFFSFFSLVLIFTLKLIFISLQESNYNEVVNNKYIFNPIRNDILDRNGVLLSRNIIAHHAAIKPSLIKDKKKFTLKIKLAFPDIDGKKLINDLNNKKYFYLKKRLTDIEKEKFFFIFN